MRERFSSYTRRGEMGMQVSRLADRGEGQIELAFINEPDNFVSVSIWDSIFGGLAGGVPGSFLPNKKAGVIAGVSAGVGIVLITKVRERNRLTFRSPLFILTKEEGCDNAPEEEQLEPIVSTDEVIHMDAIEEELRRLELDEVLDKRH